MIKKKFKVLVLIKGGLGNQLFCYAAARRLAYENNAELIIDHISSFKRDYKYKQIYQLDHFNVSGRLAKYTERLEPFGRIRHKLSRSLNHHRTLSKKTYITDEKGEIFTELKKDELTHSVILNGYWQNELYFNDIKEIIKKELSVKPPKDTNNQNYAKLINDKISIAVHVRWFEKGINDPVNTIKLEYYKKAINYCEAHLEKPSYYLFSDDIASSMKNISFPNDRLIPVDIHSSKEKAYADFWLMTQCKHFIIANSTFSWWAAWLGEQKHTIILYPGEDFQNSGSWNFIKTAPSRWTIIER
jgi:hypothetical protein